MNWPYSSLPHYIRDWRANWIVPSKIYQLYEQGTYRAFLENDDEDKKSMEAELVDTVLADS